MLRFLIEPSAFYRWFWGSRGKDCPGTNGQCPSFSWTHQPSRGNETTSWGPRFLLGCGGSPAEKPRLSRRCGFSVAGPTFPGPFPRRLTKGAERENCTEKEQGERSPKWHLVSFLGGSVVLSLTLCRAMCKRHHTPSCAVHSCAASFLPICYLYICFSGTIEKEWERCSKCLKQVSSAKALFGMHHQATIA